MFFHELCLLDMSQNLQDLSRIPNLIRSRSETLRKVGVWGIHNKSLFGLQFSKKVVVKMLSMKFRYLTWSRIPNFMTATASAKSLGSLRIRAHKNYISPETSLSFKFQSFPVSVLLNLNSYEVKTLSFNLLTMHLFILTKFMFTGFPHFCDCGMFLHLQSQACYVLQCEDLSSQHAWVCTPWGKVKLTMFFLANFGRGEENSLGGAVF